MSDEEIENKAEVLVTQHTETELVKLVVAIDNEVGDPNFTQFLLRHMVRNLTFDMSIEEIKDMLDEVLTEE